MSAVLDCINDVRFSFPVIDTVCNRNKTFLVLLTCHCLVSSAGMSIRGKAEEVDNVIRRVSESVNESLERLSTPDSPDCKTKSIEERIGLLSNLCLTLEDRRSSSSIAGEQMLRKILNIQLILAELLGTENEQSPLEMAQKISILFRDKEETIDDIDELVANTLNMTTHERPRKTVLNKVHELALAYTQRIDRPDCTVGTQTGDDSWLERAVRTGTLFLMSGTPVTNNHFTVIPTWAEGGALNVLFTHLVRPLGQSLMYFLCLMQT